jgi:hypothetical protein
MGFGDEFLVLAVVGYVFQLFSVAALLAAAGAALYCAVQMKKVLAELRAQTAALRRLAGEPPAEGKPAEE